MQDPTERAQVESGAAQDEQESRCMPAVLAYEEANASRRSRGEPRCLLCGRLIPWGEQYTMIDGRVFGICQLGSCGEEDHRAFVLTYRLGRAAVSGDELLAEVEGVLMRRAGKRRISAEQRLRVLKKCGYKCMACGARDDLSIDHLRAVSLKGTDEDDNLQVLCRRCNSRKGNRE